MKKTYYIIEHSDITAAEKAFFPEIAEVILEIGMDYRSITKDRNHNAELVGDTLSFRLPPLVAPAPLVPLGPNRFRNGIACRVICNDGNSAMPVIALGMPKGSSEEQAFTYYAGGDTLKNGESQWDLVGHLPPKPREVWILENPDGLLPGPVTPIAQSGSEWKRFKEVVE